MPRSTDAHRRARAVRLTCLITLALLCAWAPAAAHAAFGIKTFSAQVKQADDSLATQAGSHPFVGVTSFTMNTTSSGAPDGSLQDVRVDIPSGLVPNPQATPHCSDALFAAGMCPASSQVGTEELTAYVLLAPSTVTVPLYNMDAGPDHVADIAFAIPLLAPRTDIIGGVRDTSDYGEFFTISGIPATPGLISSTLTFWGVPADAAHDAERGRSCTPMCVGGGAASPADPVPFLTLPTACGPPLATKLTAWSHEDPAAPVTATDTPPVGVTGCDKVPFAPSVAVTPDTTRRDTPVGTTVTLHVPQTSDPGVLGTAHVSRAVVQLPDGLTLNPSAATGLEGCTDAQFAIGATRDVACPAASKIGTASITTPVLPAALTGSIYLGRPLPADPYRIFLVAAGFGVSVRLAGSVHADGATGRLTATFSGLPQVPFSDVALQFRGGPQAPLATPLACGTATTTAALSPHSGRPDATATSAFTVDADGKGGACGPAPFALGFKTSTTSTRAGGFTGLAATITRADGQQALSRIAVSEPPGLLGMLTSVQQCPAADADAGTCPPLSRIGSVSVGAGSGAEPFVLSGPAYLTGPHDGAPYGLVFVVRVIAGPFDLGTVIVHAGVSVDRRDAHLTVSSDPLPTILQGIPLRLRSVAVTVDRTHFLFNPTSCDPFVFAAAFGSTAAATQSATSPFRADHCADLSFTPHVSATSPSRISRAGGAALSVTVSGDPGGSNLRSVSVRLPDRLSVRLPVKPCKREVFLADPATCNPESLAGSAVATTPILDEPLRGPVYLVAAPPRRLPNLEVLLRGAGIAIDLTGTVLLDSEGVTTSFEALPDAPITMFRLDLPAGKDSALFGNRSLCTAPIALPTTMIGQNGAKLEQGTPLSVPDCAVKVLRRRFKGHVAYVTVEVPAAGRLRATGGVHLRRVTRAVRGSGEVTLRIPLTRRGVRALKLRHGRKLVKHLTVTLDAAGASAAGIPPARSSARTILNFRPVKAKRHARAPRR